MQVLLVIGVSGSGKSTIGSLLAERLNGTFLDADDCHPPANVDKMATGIPLTDQDRFPWLDLLVDQLKSREASPQPLVLACSALKKSYRAVFRQNFPDLQVIYLRGAPSTILGRMQARSGHFMKAVMLKSQLADLEEPKSAITVDVDGSIEEIVDAILKQLG